MYDQEEEGGTGNANENAANLLKPGVYKARALSGVLTESKEGKPQIAVEFEIEGGDRIAWWSGFVSDKAIQYTLNGLRTCGWSNDDLTDLQGITNNEVELVIEHHTYNEKTSARIKYINKPGRAIAKPMEPATAKTFAERMRGAAMKAPKVVPPGELQSDTIPF